MTKLKAALVGCGRIAPKHLNAIHDLRNDLELVGVCDLDFEKAERTAKQFGTAPFTSLPDMIDQVSPDILSILTWSGTHAKMALDCAGRVPNLIIEKPMALLLHEADALIEKCKNTKTRLFVVKQNRYNPPIVALKNALDQKRFGKILMGTVRVRWSRDEQYYQQDFWRGTWALDGGVIANQASHHIDLLIWTIGPVESVIAKSATYLAPIEAEDTCVALLKFENGAMGIIEATTCTRPKDIEGSISILGEGGAVEIAGFAVNRVRTWQFTDPRPEDSKMLELATNPPDVYGFGHLEFLKAVVLSIREGLPPPISGADGRKSVELINAIYESAESGKEIFLRNFKPSLSKLGKSIK